MDTPERKQMRANFRKAFNTWEGMISSSPQPVMGTDASTFQDAINRGTEKLEQRMAAFEDMKKAFDVIVKKHGAG